MQKGSTNRLIGFLRLFPLLLLPPFSLPLFLSFSLLPSLFARLRSVSFSALRIYTPRRVNFIAISLHFSEGGGSFSRRAKCEGTEKKEEEEGEEKGGVGGGVQSALLGNRSRRRRR